MYPYDPFNPFGQGPGFTPPPLFPPIGGPGIPGGPGRPGRPGGFPPGRPDGAPVGPPPSFTPQQPIGIFAVDPGAIRTCRRKYTYIWPVDSRRGFWTYLTFVGRTSVAGYRWTGYRWVFFGTDLRNISSFVCY